MKRGWEEGGEREGVGERRGIGKEEKGSGERENKKGLGGRRRQERKCVRD